MSKEKGLAVILIAGLTMIIWGLHGILKRKVVANQAHLVLSVGQLITGLISLVIYIVVYLGIITW